MRIRAACLAAALAAAAGASAGGPPPAKVALAACVVQDNPPFSLAGSERPGIDAEAARLIAGELGRELRLQWVQVPARGGFGRALKDSVQNGTCDLFMGVPTTGEMRGELAGRHLHITRPYLAVGYLIVSAPGSVPATLADARRARRLGASTATPADLVLHREQYNRIPYGNNRDLLDALVRHEIDLALAWTPAIAELGSGTSPVQVVVAAEQLADPMLRTPLAIATRASEPDTSHAVDQAVERLQAQGRFAQLAQRYGLPYLATELATEPAPELAPEPPR
jgi:ABC-type amino acid transport substrate-binding protein